MRFTRATASRAGNILKKNHQPSPCRPGRAPAGFTLLEVMVVIAVLGLVVTIAAVRADIFAPAFKLRAAAADLTGLVALAHDRSALDRRAFGIIYDLEKDRAALADPAEIPLAAEAENLEAAARKIAGWIDLPRGIEITRIIHGKNDTVYRGYFLALFKPTGVVNRHVIEIAGRDGSLQHLSVNPLTAEVTIGEGKYEPSSR